MNIRELEKAELKSMDEILDVVGFDVRRQELSNEKGIDTGFDTIYKKKGGASLGVVGREYQMVTHREALTQVRNVLEKNKLKVKPLKVQLTDGGARMYAQFMLNKKTDLGITVRTDRKVGDYIAPGFMVTNSYDRGLRYGIELYVYRLRCTNGMVGKDLLFNERKRHTKGLDLDSMVEGFVQGFEKFDEVIVPQVAGLTTQLLTPKDLQEELNKVPGWIQGEAIEYLREGNWVNLQQLDDGLEVELIDDLTRWDLLNAYTYVMSHSVTQNPKVAMELNRKISDRFLGVS